MPKKTVKKLAARIGALDLACYAMTKGMLKIRRSPIRNENPPPDDDELGRLADDGAPVPPDGEE